MHPFVSLESTHSTTRIGLSPCDTPQHDDIALSAIRPLLEDGESSLRHMDDAHDISRVNACYNFRWYIGWSLDAGHESPAPLLLARLFLACSLLTHY
jgi:hypothetical protein